MLRLLVKCVNEAHINTIVDLFNNISKTGIFRRGDLRHRYPSSTCQKKQMPRNVVIIALKIIHKRLHPKFELDLGETQFSFRQGLKTKEALSTFTVQFQRFPNVNLDIYGC